MKRYLIYCCAGTGGLFLTTVFAQILGYKVQSNFSSTGHAHDMGKGNWQGANSVCFMGNHWHITYRPGFPLYYSHQIPDNFHKTNPDVKIVKIAVDPVDYRKVTELYVKKAWPDMWTLEEYQKWASPEYPPYSKNNIAESDLVCNDLINDLLETNIVAWHVDNIHTAFDFEINFRTVMGLDGQDLVDVVCQIVDEPGNSDVKQYVKQYQEINRQLYFKNYV